MTKGIVESLSILDIERYSSFSYISKKIKAQKQTKTINWLYKKTYKDKNRKRNRIYLLLGLSKLEPLVSVAAKLVARCFY